MCGIVGYSGYYNVKHTLLTALNSIQYRGYDSWGYRIGGEYFVSEEKKYLGRIDTTLIPPRQVDNIKNLFKEYGIAHTRWATNGNVSLENCHPHTYGHWSIVHNGIITNIDKIKTLLPNLKTGGDTDTEIAVQRLSAIDDIYKFRMEIEGDNAFIVLRNQRLNYISSRCQGLYHNPNCNMYNDCNAEIFAFVTGIGILYLGNNGLFCSDLNGLRAGGATSAMKLEPGMVYTASSFKKEFDLEPEEVISKNEEHRFLQEIKEQNVLNLVDKEKFLSRIRQKNNIVFFGCGSSYNACLLGSKYLNKCGFNTRAEYASELEWNHKDDLFVALSQSGETKDIIVRIKELQDSGKEVIALTNNKQSTVAKICEYYYLNCGKEVAVAASKSFLAQCMMFFFESNNDNEDIVKNLYENREIIEEIVEQCHEMSNFIFLGNGLNYPIALEGELKLKEVANVWTDAMVSSEIKHGPIACVNDKTLAIFVVSKYTDEIIANMNQIRSRGGKIMIVGIPTNKFVPDYSYYSYNNEVYNVIPLQLFAYYMAKKLGLDPDTPVNLAKSVTV